MAEVARKAFGMRYRAMPYLYTAFFDSHQFGCPTMRPLFFTFPNDQQTWTADTQFMIGDGLMVVPCLQENGTSVNAYFPQGMWYSIYNYVPVDASTAATTLSLEVRQCCAAPACPLAQLCLTAASLHIAFELSSLHPKRRQACLGGLHPVLTPSKQFCLVLLLGQHQALLTPAPVPSSNAALHELAPHSSTPKDVRVRSASPG